MIALGAIVAVTAATVGLGIYGVRLARTTSDLFVASRAVTPWWNAAAISGEYLSAASFLGIAGLQMKLGSGALWLPLGFTAGYLALLLFVAAPLRRFGAYTISDFAEARLRSPRIRLLAAVVVLGITGFYLVPQLKGAGLTLGEVTGAPYWVGVVVVGGIVAGNVASGGMRGITYVQAFQYWTKTFAIALPACLLLIHLGGLPERAAMFGRELPRAPAAGLTVTLDGPQRVTFPEATAYSVDGRGGQAAAGEERTLPAGTLSLPADAVVPVAEGIEPKRGEDWARPVDSGGESSPVLVYSLLLATFLGTMGLPHILVRFYTNPDGPAARRTTVRVLGLLALFYAFPLVYGALGRVLVPELYVTGETDSVVLRLPEAAWPGLGGELLGALVAAGAFAAFMSTASGLMVSVAGTISFDLWRRGAGAVDRRRRFRLAALGGMVAPVALALVARGLDISVLVGWAFGLAASTFCPLLLLGIWWEGLTARGAATGLVAGAVVATGAIFTGLAVDGGHPTVDALLTQPAVISVPLAFAVMVLVSLRDVAGRRAAEAELLAMHAPEGLGLGAEEPLRIPAR
ncbi:MAG: cation acetate symporter [Solirubrobacteraceae bacterium]